jgi:hypothetical protein
LSFWYFAVLDSMCVRNGLAMQQYMLLERNLVYPGITRGKRLVVLAGEAKPLRVTIRKKTILTPAIPDCSVAYSSSAISHASFEWAQAQGRPCHAS